LNRFYRSRSLESLKQGEKHYLRHLESGDYLCIDQMLYELWNILNGQTCDELLAQSPVVQRFSRPLLQAVLQLLVRARLVDTDIVSPVTLPSAFVNGPLVSVVVLNMNGLEHLDVCFSSIRAQTYCNLETIMVDNGSQDESVRLTHEKFPWVRVLALGQNLGFAGGNNEGFKVAQGKYIFVVNNDVELEPDCIAELVHVMEADEQIAAAVPMLKLFYLRGFLNGIGNVVGPFGWGYDAFIGHLDVGQFQESQEVFSACFGATLLRRSVLSEIGLMDTGYYPIYYDDVDWSYRARLAGYKLCSVPRAVVYHKFSATMKQEMSPSKLRIVVRNRLRFAAKNLQFGYALRFCANYLAEDTYNLMYAFVHRNKVMVQAYGQAWSDFVRSWPDLLQQRIQVQRMRIKGVRDKSLFAVAQKIPVPVLDGNAPILTMENIVQHYLHISPDIVYRRVLVVSPDVVNVNMAGPGIRYWELARVLAQKFEVTLAVPGECSLPGEGFQVVSYRTGDAGVLLSIIAQTDVILVSGYILHKLPVLKKTSKPMIVDLYDPFIIENLHFHVDKPLSDRAMIHRNDLAVLNDQLQIGDFFVCASEKQRDYCIGLLMANQRINPHTWDDDPTLRRLIDVVPFGLPVRPPRSDAPRLKGIVPGIAADDQVILWGGGVWEWLDPLTAIRAMPQVIASCPKARLFFIGIRHPSQDFPDSRIAAQAVVLSREMGLLDRYVFFNQWTPYAERESYLLEADVGISLHLDHLETRFAFRTRLLDYIWAGLPMVVSGGDALSELIEREGIGRVVACEDVDGVAAALIALLKTPDLKTQLAPVFARVGQQFAWERVAEPLIEFCRHPHRAPDLVSAEPVVPGVVVTPKPTPAWKLPFRAWYLLRQRGLGGLGKEILSYARWQIGRLRTS